MDQDSQDGYNGRRLLCIDHGIGLIPLVVRVQEYDIIHGEPIIDMAMRKNREFIAFSCL